jgi:glutamyl-tRNA synthetase
MKGTFILRIEDTDLARSEESFTRSIISDMAWLGMNYDEFYSQSDRFDIYREYAQKLVSSDRAYKDEDSIRVRTGEPRQISFTDAVKGKISVLSAELEDFVIMKAGGTPTYNFAVVIDDALMGITHCIRGEDHITNTIKQLIIYEHLSFTPPVFAHLPLVMDADKTRLSKRKGSKDIEYYRSSGILPEALLNAIARLGWSHGNEEVFTIEELIKYFDISKISKSASIYDEEKMIWINGKHMKMQDIEKLYSHFTDFISSAGLELSGKMADAAWLKKAAGLLRSRHKTLKSLYDEIALYGSGDLSAPGGPAGAVDLKLEGAVKKAFMQAAAYISDINDFTGDPVRIEQSLKNIAEENKLKFGELASALRVALTGKTESPGLAVLVTLLGEDAKKRLSVY